jgi:hypothetical protein
MAAPLLLLLAAAGAVADRLQLLDLRQYPLARCMDGTPGGFYFRPALARANATRWVFSLEGGGECVDKPTCTGRLTSSLGSSKYFPPTMTPWQLQAAMTSVNPDLSTYNSVFIKYCSSDLHLGQMTAPSTATWGLQFSGHHILRAVLATLNSTHALHAADLVVWSGDSAGGIGCIATVDWVRDLLPGARVVGAPIGGFYFNNNQPYAGAAPPPAAYYLPWNFSSLQTYQSLWAAFVPTRCAAQHPATPWICMFAVARSVGPPGGGRGPAPRGRAVVFTPRAASPATRRWRRPCL